MKRIKIDGPKAYYGREAMRKPWEQMRARDAMPFGAKMTKGGVGGPRVYVRAVSAGGAGVRPSSVLAGAGIVRGETVRVKSEGFERQGHDRTMKSGVRVVSMVKPRFPIIPPKKVEDKKAPLEEEEIKAKEIAPAEDREIVPVKAEKPSETETRLAEYLDAAQEVKPLCDAMGEVKEERVGDETRIVLPELPFGGETEISEEPKKRKRRRGKKGKKGMAVSTEVSEAERAEVQAALEEASDAAAAVE